MKRSVFEDEGHSGHYVNLLPLMTRHLDLGRLKGLRVLDVGCGPGWWGEALLAHGADVTFIDGRTENLALVHKRHPEVTTHLMNVETDPFPVQRADLVLCMGLIYHLADPAALFEKIAAISPRVFVETICMDQVGVNIVYINEHTDTPETSIGGRACRPTPRWVMRELRHAGYSEIEDVSDEFADRPPTPTLPGLLYHWDYENTCGWRRNDCTLRRVFLATQTGRDDPLVRW